jgi:acetoin utilization protein AcuB
MPRDHGGFTNGIRIPFAGWPRAAQKLRNSGGNIAPLAGTRLASKRGMTSMAHEPVHQFPLVRQFMTPAPHTIAPTRSLAAARRTMLQHHVRHLPVLDGGRIVGLVSERDLLLVESLPGVNPTDVQVDEAMVGAVYTVHPDTPVGEVVETMIDTKAGSAVVCDGDRVLGIFTTIDALQALHALLEDR